MMWLFYIGIAVATYAGWSAAALYRNHQLAKSIGLPVIASPVSPMNLLWITSYIIFPSLLRLLPRLPFGLGRWAQYAYIAWEFNDAGAHIEDVGPAFVLSTPVRNELIIAEPAACRTVLMRSKDFGKPPILYNHVNIFGPNLDGTDGDVWRRQRRLTAPSLNEHISDTVWRESLRQVGQLRGVWLEAGSSGTRNVTQDTSTLSINVWLKAGFDMRHEFRDEHETSQPRSQRPSYRETLSAVLRGFKVLMVLPRHWLKKPFMPARLRSLGDTCDEFEQYMREMVELEKRKPPNPTETSRSLLSVLVQASEEDFHGNTNSSAYRGLADDELYGNIFVFSLAGHETVANTLAAAIVHLAAGPHWQDWIREEVQQVCGASSDPGSWAYEKTFAKLTRVHACMYETLRLNGSVPFMPKGTGTAPLTLAIGGTPRVIPPDTFVTVNAHGLHCDAKSWGPDSQAWRPDRWIRHGPKGEEQIYEPPSGTYQAWAEGPRNCPGKKFGQVEVVAALAGLLHRTKVRPVLEAGESADAARARATRMTTECGVKSITLQMNDTTRVAMAWEVT